MRSKRILTAVNWRYALGEIGLIVIGVSIALAATSWYEQRQSRNEEAAMLQQLQLTLREDLESFGSSRETLRSAVREIETFLEGFEGNSSDQRRVTDSVRAMQRFVVVNPSYGPYETLKARGLHLISDGSLRVMISSLYEDQLPLLVENAVLDRQLAREWIFSSVLEWFWYDDSGNWVLKERPPDDWQDDLATLARYRVLTMDLHYLPNFDRTIASMKELLEALNRELE